MWEILPMWEYLYTKPYPKGFDYLPIPMLPHANHLIFKQISTTVFETYNVTDFHNTSMIIVLC